MKKVKCREMRPDNLFPDPSFPLNVFMYDYEASANDWHRHMAFYELVIVCSGTAENVLPSGRELVTPGTVFLMKPGASHRYTAIRRFRHYNVLFTDALLNTGNLNFARLLAASPLSHFSEGRQCSAFFHVGESALSQLVLMLETIRTEMSLRASGWREAAFAEFIRLMIRLVRLASAPGREASGYSFQIGSAIRLMEARIGEELSLKTIAEAVHMSESCFRHHFFAVTGIAPIRYLIRMRLKKALLLLTTVTPIADIARLSGFSDQNYFTRQFRKQFGITPNAFRKQYTAQKLSVDKLLAGLMETDMALPEKTRPDAAGRGAVPIAQNP